MPRAVPAVTAALLALAVAVCGAAGTGLLGAACAVAVVGVALGWSSLLALPSPRGSAAVVAGAGLAGVVVVAATSGEPALRDLPIVVGLAVLGAFSHQLLRRDLRPRVVEGISGVLAGVLVVVSASGWLAALAPAGGAGVVLVGAAAAAGAGVASSLAGPRPWRWATAPVVGALAAAAAAAISGGPAVGASAVVGVVVGLVAAVIGDLLAPLPGATRTRPGIALGSAPVAAAGLVIYVAARVLSS